MQKIPFILSALVILFSCQRINKQERTGKYIKEPELASKESYHNPVYNEPFFYEDHFNYSYNQGDSTKVFYTSETIIINDSNPGYFLRTCQSYYRNDSLLLHLSDIQFSGGDYELDIIKSNGQFTSYYNQMYSVPDCTYRKPIFKVLDQEILLDRTNYKMGDSLKGKISLDISALHTASDERYTDTINIRGLIKTVVK